MTLPVSGRPLSADADPRKIASEIVSDIRAKIGLAADAQSRALDALACDDPTRCNWQYIYSQLAHAQEYCMAGMMLADTDDDDDDANAPSRAEIVGLVDRDPFLPDPTVLPMEGGEA